MNDWSSRFLEYEQQCVEAGKMAEGPERDAAYLAAEALRQELLSDPNAPKEKVYSDRQKLVASIAVCWLNHKHEMSEYQRNAWGRWLDSPTNKTPLAHHAKLAELAEEWQDCVGAEHPKRGSNLYRFFSAENQALEAAELLGGLRGELDVTVRGGDLKSVAIDAGVAFNALVELQVPIEMDVGQGEINRIVQAKPRGDRILLAELLTAMNTACEALGEMQVLANRGEAESLSMLVERLPNIVVSQEYRNELIWEFGAIDGRSQSVKAIDDEPEVETVDQATVPDEKPKVETVDQAALRWSSLRKFEGGPTDDQQAFVVALVGGGGSSLPIDIGIRMGKDWQDPKRSCALLIKKINDKLEALGESWQIVPEDRGEVVLRLVSEKLPKSSSKLR